jgi:DNA-binding Xre family transcriptional regulator
MPVKSRINAEYLVEICWKLRLSLNQLNDRAGLGKNYIYRLTGPKGREINVNLRTVDMLCNAIEQRMLELQIPPPDDIWHKLVVIDLDF